jgi:hypothetical protein
MPPNTIPRTPQPSRLTRTAKAANVLGVLFLVCVVSGIFDGPARWTFSLFGLYCLGQLLFRPAATYRAFFSSSSTAANDDERSLISLYFLALALLLTVLAIVTSATVFVCLCVSFLWLGLAYLTKVRLEVAISTKRFLYYLSRSSVELFCILTIALAAYALFALCVRSLATDAKTLIELRSLEEHIAKVHEHLEAASPSKLHVIFLAVTLYIGRIVAVRYEQGVTLVTRTRQVVYTALSWVHRLALFSLVAASFTFLATRADGPPAPLEARLKQMKEDYTQFRSQVQQALVIEAKLQLIHHAWQQAPPALKRSLSNAATIVTQRSAFAEEEEWADHEYGMGDTPSSETAAKYRNEKTPPAPPQPQSASFNGQDHASDDFSSSELHGAAVDSIGARAKVEGDSSKLTDEMNKELAKDVQVFALNVDRITDNVGFLKILTSDYPLAGEFLDAVNDAFNDYFFDKLQPAVDRIIQKTRTSSKRPLADQIRAEAMDLAQNAPLAWHPGQPSESIWETKLGVVLAAEQTDIKNAYRQLDIDVKPAERNRFAKLVHKVQDQEATAHSISQVMSLYGDPQDKIDAKLQQIEALPPDPHPLSRFKHPVRPKPASPDDFDEDQRPKPPTVMEVPDLRRPGVPAVPSSSPPRTRPHPHPAPGSRVFELSILSERCDLLIGGMLRRSKSFPGAYDDLRGKLGEAVVARYETNADGVRRSLDAGDAPQLFVGQFPRAIDSSTEGILKAATHDDDSWIKLLLEDLSEVR